VPRSTHVRSIRLAASLAGVIVLALAGCGRSTDTAESLDSVNDGPATGTVTVWAPDGDATVLDDVIAPYLAENPELDVELTLVPSDEYMTKLQSAIAAGSGPDIAQLYTEAQAQFIHGGSFAPVPEGAVDSSAFFPAAWESGVVDGIAYSVPWYAYTYTLVYRKDFAEAAGAEAPTTWEDTVPFFESLQRGGAERGLGAEIGWGIYAGYNLAQYVWQDGGELLNDEQTDWMLDTPEVANAFSFYASFFTSGVADTDSPTFLDAQPYFVEGKTGAIVTGPWVIGQFDDVAGEDGWTAEHVSTAPLPSGSADNVGPVGGGSWGVLTDSDNPEAAWKLIRYLSEPETQVAQFQAYSSMPAVESAWQDPAIADEPLLDPFFMQMQNSRTYPQVPNWAQVATQFGAELESVAKGTQTAEEAAAKIQSFAEGLGTGLE
jgi:multiple sugar transport system substrate-binding protein